MFERKKNVTKVISPIQSNGLVVVAAGIDAGSTETRVCLADYRDTEVFGNPERHSEALERLLTTYIIPSTYATIEDARELLPASGNLEDNYDSNVILLNSTSEQPMIGKSRVIRGRKMIDTTGAVYRYLDSSTNKSDNIIFYTNIIDVLGYAILQKYSGRIPKEVRVHLMLSVRPKELSSICRNKMNSNLIGTYMFIWGSVQIAIHISSLNFTTEPEAEITGTSTVCDMRVTNGIDVVQNQELAQKLNESESYIHIEGGGSSIGVEVLRNSEFIASCSSTFELGGNYLVQVFKDRIREQYGRAITDDSASRALISCLLRNGRSQIDVSEIVAECRNKVGQAILERLRHNVIDITPDLTLNDIEFISLGGRLFRPDECNNSIAYYFEQYVKQISPCTDVISLTENFIPQGNLVLALGDEKIVEDINGKGAYDPATQNETVAAMAKKEASES